MSLWQFNIPLRKTISLSDVFVLAALGALLYAALTLGRQWTGVFHANTEISLSPLALPGYTFFSLMRGVLAYFCSLAFTLVYGYVAANNKRAEKILLPLLDILQSLPVLSFLPAFLLAIIYIFPNSNFGLELVCILAIFTGQAWNMTFSFYNSLHSIPSEMREVAKIHRFGWWRRFMQLELPYSTIGLVWNSMMSFAGGWFFLTVVEAASIGNFDYRLPGLGSYMAVASQAGNVPAMIYGSIAMAVMIVAVDRLLWKPIVVWSDKFKFEETSGGVRPKSFVLDMLRSSHIASRSAAFIKRLFESTGRAFKRVLPAVPATPHVIKRSVLPIIILTALAALSIFGAVKFVGLISEVPGGDWMDLIVRSGATFLRVIAVLVLSTLWTIPAGVAIGRNEKLARVLQPLVQIAASYPAPMLFPFVIVLLNILHIDFQIGAMVLMMLGTQWYILFNTIAGAMAIPSDLVEAARTFRFGTVQKWKKLILPALFPFLVTGWLTAAGGAWNASIVAEFETFSKTPYVAYGIGAKICQATNDNNFALLAASSFLLVIIVVATNRFFWKRLYKIAETRYSLNK